MSANTSLKPAILMAVNLVPNKMGAYEKFMLHFAHRCRQKEIDVHFLIAGDPHPQVEAGLQEANATLHIMPTWNDGSKIKQLARFVRRYSALARDYQCQIVAFSFCEELPVLTSLLWTRLWYFHIPARAIWHQQSEIQEPRNTIIKYFSKLRFVSWVLDGVSVVYRRAGETLQHRAIDPKKIHVIYNGAASPNVAAQQSAAKRADLGVQENEIMLFSAASLIARKNVAMQLRALACALPKVPTLKLFIAGDGDQEQDLRELANRLEIADRVFFLGRRSDVPALIAASDLCLLTSQAEGLPFFCGEVFAQGKTMIATPAGGVPEIVENEVNGVIVPFDDSDALAKQIYRLTRDVRLRRRFEAAAADAYRSRFSVDAMVDQYFDYYMQSPRASLQYAQAQSGMKP